MGKNHSKARIEKPEDKIWHEWFNKLSPQDHKQYMGKLGLTDEDMGELPEVERELHSAGEEEPAEQKEPEKGSAGKAKKSVKKKARKKR